MINKLGLYVHVPFCRRKCFYCDFVSCQYNQELSNKYIEAIIIEATKYKKDKLYTIYIGGGTPSILNEFQLEHLITNLKSNFDVSNLQEFTVELNPESTTIEKLKLLYGLGVTRLSFGLQSTNDEYLKILGRLHDYKKFIDSFNLAQQVGFKNINVDLIYGIPTQTIEAWKQDLNTLINLDTMHISLYPLTIEQGTVFYNKNIQVNYDLQRNMYDSACEILDKNNFEHYEISNWAKQSNYSKHNILYWKNCSYIGLGPSASSYYNRYRFKNVINIKEYIDNIGKNKNIKIENEYINDEMYNIETIMLGLRLKQGVDICLFNNKKEILNKFIIEGFLQNKNNKISLTQKGLFVSNSIISEFI